jgi:hypothetical protein
MVHCCCETKKVEEEEEEVPCWTLHLLLRRLVHHPLVENSGTPEQRTESSGYVYLNPKPCSKPPAFLSPWSKNASRERGAMKLQYVYTHDMSLD